MKLVRVTVSEYLSEDGEGFEYAETDRWFSRESLDEWIAQKVDNRQYEGWVYYEDEQKVVIVGGRRPGCFNGVRELPRRIITSIEELDER